MRLERAVPVVPVSISKYWTRKIWSLFHREVPTGSAVLARSAESPRAARGILAARAKCKYARVRYSSVLFQHRFPSKLEITPHLLCNSQMSKFETLHRKSSVPVRYGITNPANASDAADFVRGLAIVPVSFAGI
jgi:hypothetical protein